MSKSRRKQNTDITRIVGIVFLEVLAAIVLLNLAGFAQQQRTEAEPPTAIANSAATLAMIQSADREPYPYPEPLKFAMEKTLPKVAVGRYNIGGNF